ncbi:hypothetical protein ACJJTC_006820 [Scirpophaga incertulas]
MESDFRSPLIKDKKKIDNKEVNGRMVKFLDSRINPEKENHHLSFFKGIIPILNTLTIEETLEFQASVMTMLQKIKSGNYERPNYGHWRNNILPSTSSQTSNPIPASPSASSNRSIHSQDSDYLDFEGI